MPVEFKAANAIVLSPQLNPAIITQAWMIQQLQILPNEFLPEGNIQLPVVFSSQTRRFQLMVLPDRIQFALQPGHERDGDLVRQVVTGVMAATPHALYTAIGLNFVWTVYSEGETNRTTSRNMFYRDGIPFFAKMNVEDARFGAYASKDALGFRLKVDAKPLAEENPHTDSFRILFNFNFHQDLTDNDRTEQIRQLLTHWVQAYDEANRIVHEVSQEAGL